MTEREMAKNLIYVLECRVECFQDDVDESKKHFPHEVRKCTERLADEQAMLEYARQRFANDLQ